MKFFSFVCWKYRQSTWEDKCYWAGTCLLGIGAGADFNKLIICLALLCWMPIFINILVKHYQQEYKKFVEEKNQLFTTIKNSDQK